MSKTEADEVASCVVRLFGEISREPVTLTRKPPKSAPQIISLYPGEAWTIVDRVG
jgi:hypothetical protein